MTYDQKPWLAAYDSGVPETIEIEHDSLVERFEEMRREFARRPVIHFMGVTWTYEELFAQGDAFAGALSARGLGKGDVVAVNLPNIPQYVIALAGALRLGCAVSGLSPLLTTDEMAYQINDCGAKALVTLDVLYEQRFRAAAGRVPRLDLAIATNIADYLPWTKRFLGRLLKKIPTGRTDGADGCETALFKDFMAGASPAPPPPEIGREDPCFIQYTGGTTGTPKGAVLTHGNMLANLAQFEVWSGDEPGTNRVVSGFPMFHTAGLALAVINIALGNPQALIPDPRNTKHIVGEIEKYNPTLMINVPSLAYMLLGEEGFRRHDWSDFRAWVSGAAPFSVEGIRRLEEVIGRNKVLEVWGMTETSPLITCNPYRGEKKAGSVGLPLPSTELRVVDLETGEKPVPLGEEGELICSGPQVMQGYRNKPDETANSLREHDGRIWMHTGDVGRMDEEGFVYIVDRAKDMLNVGGYKVFSSEVENKLYEHPAIELCALVGLPNPDRPDSDIVKLVVQKSAAERERPDEEVREEILAFAREHLAPYKTPKKIEFINDMPLTAVGKVDKKSLRV